MRFALAVVAAGAVQVVPYLNAERWSGVGGVLISVYLLLAAAGAGFFAARRAALAGALSVFLGAAFYGALAYATRAERDVGADALLSFEATLFISVLPYALAGAVFGAAGGNLRTWALRRS